MSLLFWFIATQILIALAYFACMALQTNLSFSAKLRLHYASLISVFSILILQAFIPTASTFIPVEKYFSQGLANARAITQNASPRFLKIAPSSSFSSAIPSVPLPYFSTGLLLLFCVAAALKIKKDLDQLKKIEAGAFCVRRIGRISILAHAQISVPLTYRRLRRATVIVPMRLLSSPLDYRMSIAHELQHHRQYDPLWMYVLEIFKVFSFLNPIAKLWIHKITDLQEFACDETLVDKSRVKIRQYARCLLKTAESALQPEFAPGCATGLIFRMERYQLKRRISMLVNQTQSSMKKRSTTLSLRLALFTAFVGVFAYGAKSIAQSQVDRTYTLAEAQNLALAITDAGSLPVTINAEVVKALNAYLGTPAKRYTLSTALTRMQKDYKSDVDAMLNHYDLPRALDAMPLIESYYQNLPQSGPMKSAGIWQFIPSTAIKMGMTVNASQDERLEVAKLNSLAGRLLKSNAIYFDDIGLSILAFNWGDSKVSQLIAKTHSRDPWVLVKAFPNDTYLPKLMAAMLIVANPKVTE